MILVDPRFGETREKTRSERLEAFLSTLAELGVVATEDRLDSGDFCFVGNGPDGPIKVGIELKTVSDFITSMLNGHLADQLSRMSADGYRRIYVIVEGFYRAKRPSGLVEVPRGAGWRVFKAGPRPIFWADVEKFITGLEEAGVRVRKTRTTTETARVIGQVLYGFWAKEYDAHKSLDVVYQTPVFTLKHEDEVTQRIRRVLLALKAGVGVGRSKAVAEKFRSVIGLVQADAKAWEGIDGIGRTIAGDVYRAIRAEIPKSSRAGQVPARRVSARVGVAAADSRNPRQRQDRRLAAGRAAERGVRAIAGGRRAAR